MKKDFVVDKKYLNIPVCAQKEEKLLRVFLLDEEGKEEEKFTEVMVPVDAEQEEEYVCDFYAQIPLPAYQGRKIRVSMKEGDAPESFLAAVFLSDEPQKAEDTHPVIHFAADSGWTNDPNGMIYDGEFYHLYFQYNPFDTAWNNMSWGHAVSKDMLH